jgi:hypothetical protein
MTHTLKFSLNTDPPLEKLKYPARINVGKLNAKLRGVKSDDLSGRVLAYVTALTDESNGIIKALDTADYTIASSVATYFF